MGFGWAHSPASRARGAQVLALFQYQMVADLFQEEKDAMPTAAVPKRAPRINVRSAKPAFKAANKEHRKTVGHQVM